MRIPGVAVPIGDVALREEVIALPFHGSCSPASDALLHTTSRASDQRTFRPGSVVTDLDTFHVATVTLRADWLRCMVHFHDSIVGHFAAPVLPRGTLTTEGANATRVLPCLRLWADRGC